MRIFVLTATYELRVSRKSHLRDHPNLYTCAMVLDSVLASGAVDQKRFDANPDQIRPFCFDANTI
jgi:hypothetical protein